MPAWRHWPDGCPSGRRAGVCPADNDQTRWHPAPARAPAAVPLNLPPQQQPVVGRVTESAPEASSLRRMTPEEVDRLKRQQAGTLPVTEMSATEFQSLAPAQRLQYLQKLNAERQARIDRANLLKAPAAAADLPAAFYQGATTLLDMGANAIGVPRIGRALGIYEPDVTRVEIPKFSSMTPNFDIIRRVEAENQPLTEKDLLTQLRQQDVKRATEAKTKAEAAAKEQVRLSSEKANKRLTDLVNLAPQALQKDETKYLVSRAQELRSEEHTSELQSH